ncbi:hypothetical protein POM88_034893 [Heracleum sosnowskyi]|uniref:Uncharacterized protein n=1 Tax=Heracleum sosnowskyi TaxID=360622 RepID=A0AAD8HLE6_9APIA|nr:hypothetical protein POM88_034893 [Heracleum sosnowskyi]
MTEDKEVVNFVCLNIPSRYLCGSLSLPQSFTADQGLKVPKRIYLELPRGALWRGTYVQDRNCIEDLDCMFKCYRLKPYHVVNLHYAGGVKFGVEIFSPYGVEIDYTVEGPPSQKPIFTRNGGSWLNEVYYMNMDFEVDKLQA